MTFILFLSSAVVGLWVLLNFTPCNIGKKLFLWLFHFELLQNLVKVCTHWKNLSSVLIYLYRSWCSICKQLHRGLSLKNSFQTLLYAFQKILHHFWSTICHSHILIRKVVCDTTGRFCQSRKMLISMQSSSNPSKDWSEHLGVGMYALMMIKDFGFVQSLWETCISKEVSGSTIEFLMSICC